MLDLGFVTAILGEKTIEDVIDFASSNGFKCIEVMCWPASNIDTRRYAGISHINADDLPEERISSLQNLLKSKGVYISGLGYYPNPLDPDKEQAKFFREHIKKVISAAAKLNIPVVNTFIGRDPSLNIKDNLKLFAEYWPEIISHAESLGIKIGIENCPMFFTNDEWPGGKNLATTPAIWDKMFEIIPSKNLGLNYDPSHLIWQQMDEVQPIYDYADRLFHIHLKDVKIYKNKLNRVGIMANPLEYHSPKLPGLGDVNWRGFFTALTDVRYRGPVCIEVEDKAYEGSEEDVISAILTSRNYLRQFLA
jgi:sugar phosphate isomerase/epimerase